MSKPSKIPIQIHLPTKDCLISVLVLSHKKYGKFTGRELIKLYKSRRGE